METSDYIALGSAILALIALVLGILNRMRDKRTFLNRALRDEVIRLFVASETTGLRTLDALGQGGQENEERLEYLSRTATQLDVVGHTALAEELRGLCSKWPSLSEQQANDLRNRFLHGLKRRLV
jgi:hypothetical protein